MSKTIIGLVGGARSGKSTAANILVDRLGAKIMPLAGPLKGMLESLGVPYEALYGDDKEVPLRILNGKTARHAMQTLGTEWGRGLISPTLWTDIWQRNVLNSRAELIVCDDVRFPNEVEMIRALGGNVIKIVRPGRPRIATGGHASEAWETLPTDATVINEGSLAGLSDLLVAAISDLDHADPRRLAS